MKGDFSKWYFDRKNNWNGVLHQQGRVLLDNDWNDQTRIINDWQKKAGQDIIGPGVAAIPADQPDGFKIDKALRNFHKEVIIVALPGRAWADGLLVYLDRRTVFENIKYLAPPMPGSDTGNFRDAVILEVWQESINGFQIPDLLIEPALGGPDTTERIHTAMTLRLLRLGEDDTCHTIPAKLKDDIKSRGKLIVSLDASQQSSGPCPQVEGGGYTGLEHNLYRIEIADVYDGLKAMFKWSQFNGGLVGRGTFKNHKVTGIKNLQAITASGLDRFYLEAVEFDPVGSATFGSGHWKVAYGTNASLNNGELDLDPTQIFGDFPSSARPVFFRLWNGIEKIETYQNANPVNLQEGIMLKFEAGGSFTPPDYWTFYVRAGGLGNANFLVDTQPPQGIHYHRVPLAILNWSGEKVLERIDDCRDVFKPLTNLNICCSFTIGDGKSSHGDYDSIEEALKHIPASGGEICLLPGLHRTNAIFENRSNIKIKGCDSRTAVIPRESRESIFRIIDSQNITIEHLDIISAGLEAAIVIRAAESKENTLKCIEIRNNRILSYKSAIMAEDGAEIDIHHNKIRMLDRIGGDTAIYLRAQDSLIEKNEIIVVPNTDIVIGDPAYPEEGDFHPTDPAVILESIYDNEHYIRAYSQIMWNASVISISKNAFKTTGGIQIGAESERIKIVENLINGGSGNGITLGSLDFRIPDRDSDGKGYEFYDDEKTEEILSFKVVTEKIIPLPGIEFSFIRETDGISQSTISDEMGKFKLPIKKIKYLVKVISHGYEIINIEKKDYPHYHITVRTKEVPSPKVAFISDILIEKNKITNMGISGIGSPLLMNPRQKEDRSPSSLNKILTLVNLIIDLVVYRNNIFNCLQNPFEEFQNAMAEKIGFGGITLGICDNLTIQENRIENNGRSHRYPICGIFLAAGEYIEINENRIINNGPLDKKNASIVEPGIRGGVVLGHIGLIPDFSIIKGKSSYDKTVGLLGTPDMTRDYSAEPIARVHDNVVDQPVGKALDVGAFGPVFIQNNFFYSEVSVNGELLTREASMGSIIRARAALDSVPITNMPDKPLTSSRSLPPDVRIENNTIFSKNTKSFALLVKGNNIELMENEIVSSGLGGINIVSTQDIRVHANSFWFNCIKPVKIDSKGRVIFIDNFCDTIIAFPQTGWLSGRPQRLSVVSEGLKMKKDLDWDADKAKDKGLEAVGEGEAFDKGQYYLVTGQGERYVALKGKVDKLCKLIIEQGESEKKILEIGKTWDVGGGWALFAKSVTADLKATPREVWFTLSKDGKVKKDDNPVAPGASRDKPIYTYVEKNLAGEIDVPVFVTFIEYVFAGAESDFVQLRYTWAIATSLTTPVFNSLNIVSLNIIGTDITFCNNQCALIINSTAILSAKEKEELGIETLNITHVYLSSKTASVMGNRCREDIKNDNIFSIRASEKAILLGNTTTNRIKPKPDYNKLNLEEEL